MKQQSKTIKGWISTDKNGSSYFDKKKPIRSKQGSYWLQQSPIWLGIGTNLFGQTWKDEPWRVSITITKNNG